MFIKSGNWNLLQNECFVAVELIAYDALVSVVCNSSTLIRWPTLFTIPNICGVASTSTACVHFTKPSATKVLLAVSFLSIPLLICVTFIRFILYAFCFALSLLTDGIYWENLGIIIIHINRKLRLSLQIPLSCNSVTLQILSSNQYFLFLQL